MAKNMKEKSPLLEKLKKNSTIKETQILSESKFFNAKDVIPTPVPMINVALSGKVDGGLSPGLLVLAGPSKHFKTAFSLLMANSYMAKYPDAVIIFYDSEFGTPLSYFDSFGINKDRVLHTPITDIEKLKFDIMAQLDGIERGDRVIILVDSLGNLASKKEVEDALKESGAADMTRAKQIKSLFRMVTPHLTMKDIPLVVVNHIYMTQEMYSKAVVSGGTGVMLSADNVWILGRQQEKDKEEGLQGYHFIINIEKSRHVKEKSKIPITVTFKGGIAIWSGLMDMALEAGYLTNGSPGWVNEVNVETGEVSEKNLAKKKIENDGEFWKDFLARTTFKDWLQEHYSLGQTKMISEGNEDEEIVFTPSEPTGDDTNFLTHRLDD